MNTERPEGFDPADVAPPPLLQRMFPVRSIALDVSGRCNLACRYCVESATQPARAAMTDAVLDRVWAWFSRSRPSSWSVHIGSGEPLLALPILERLESLVRREAGMGFPRPIFLTTNATLLERAAAEFLATSGWNIKISLDGPRAVHDRWRVTAGGRGTYDRTASATRWLAERAAGGVTVGAVLCHGTDPADVFAAARRVGARRMEFFPVIPTDRAARLESADLARYREFILDYARQLAGGEPVTPRVGRFERCVAGVMGYGNRRVGCPAARGYVGVAPDGGLYPCMRFVGLEEYRIGDLASGLDAEATLAFQRGAGRPYEQRDECRRCWAAPLCGGPCFASAALFDVRHHCEIYRSDAAAAVWLVHVLRERDPARLLSMVTFTRRTGEDRTVPAARS